MDEKICKQCGKFLPVYKGKCEVCLTGPETEAYTDQVATEEQEEVHFSQGKSSCVG